MLGCHWFDGCYFALTLPPVLNPFVCCHRTPEVGEQGGAFRWLEVHCVALFELGWHDSCSRNRRHHPFWRFGQDARGVEKLWFFNTGFSWLRTLSVFGTVLPRLSVSNNFEHCVAFRRRGKILVTVRCDQNVIFNADAANR